MREASGEMWTLRCDGGSRGNPGPGAYGFVLTDPAGVEREARGEYLGTVTNNIAEYRALIAGLEAGARHGALSVRVVMDSELVIRQMTGEYRVKNEGLKPLHAEARRKAAAFTEVAYRSVGRADNERADRLVNEALDKVLGTESPR
jgi:ribonuclease HI